MFRTKGNTYDEKELEHDGSDLHRMTIEIEVREPVLRKEGRSTAHRSMWDHE